MSRYKITQPNNKAKQVLNNYRSFDSNSVVRTDNRNTDGRYLIKKLKEVEYYLNIKDPVLSNFFHTTATIISESLSLDCSLKRKLLFRYRIGRYCTVNRLWETGIQEQFILDIRGRVIGIKGVSKQDILDVE